MVKHMKPSLVPMRRSSLALRACARASRNRDINELEKQLARLPQVKFTVTHTFTPGLYIREIIMPSGSFLTSKIHKTEHPFVISMGQIKVWTEEAGVVIFGAPFMGVTKAGTRRVLYAIEDTIWTTFHPTNETDVGKIEREIIFKHEIPTLTGGRKCLG